MRGVYLAAAELAGFGYIVSTTSRSMMGADLLVTDQRCRKAFSVQVKTNGNPATFWLIGKHAKSIKSPDHVYIFVNLNDKYDEPPDFYVVRSAVVARKMVFNRRPSGTFYAFKLKHAVQFQDAWLETFGKPF